MAAAVEAGGPQVYGHYLIAGGGIVVFDLQANNCRCFEATSAHKEIDVTAVDTDGTAYGTAGGESILVYPHR